MDVEPVGDRRAANGGLSRWLRNTNQNPDLVARIRRVRQALPGDPEFGDPLSTTGDGSVEVAARAADRLMPERDGVTREVSLAALQVWQAVSERMAGKQRDAEVTLVFTDLVGFSAWSLKAGDEATLRLLRRVALAAEPPMLDAGGHIVKRMGDGMMAVFGSPDTAVKATLIALQTVEAIDVDGYTPKMRAGIHTGRPQRIGSDWLGVDVNIAARVMERATKGGLIVSERTLEQIPVSELESLDVAVKRIRRNLLVGRQSGMPADLVMYRLKPVKKKDKSQSGKSAQHEVPTEETSPHVLPKDASAQEGAPQDQTPPSETPPSETPPSETPPCESPPAETPNDQASVGEPAQADYIRDESAAAGEPAPEPPHDEATAEDPVQAEPAPDTLTASPPPDATPPSPN